MLGRIQENRRRLERELSGTGKRRYASPVLYAVESSVARCLREHGSGRILDAGCGQGPYRPVAESVADSYESLDVERKLDDQTFVGDIQSMPEVESERYDTVICSEVLEHVPRPSDALSEVQRILKPGGILILTVPFLARLHDEPHDFYRYTQHGLRYLLEANGFNVLSLDRVGSLFSFAGHQISTALLGGTWHLPGLRWVSFCLNAILVTVPCRLADRLFGSDRLPLGYAVVARRR